MAAGAPLRPVSQFSGTASTTKEDSLWDNTSRREDKVLFLGAYLIGKANFLAFRRSARVRANGETVKVRPGSVPIIKT
jgi:hypothetical protein